MTGFKRFVLRALELLGWAIAVVMFAAVLAFQFYDVGEFQPRRVEIAQLIASAHPGERSPSPMLRQLLLTDTRGDLALQVSRILLFKLEVVTPKSASLHWHRTQLLWWLLVKLHLSEDEQLAIVCGTTFLGRRAYGFEAGAHAYFQRPLRALDEAELATLVVLWRRPSRWQNPKYHYELFKARDGLLEQTRAEERVK